MHILLGVVGGYLVSGLAAVALLDLFTGRVRSRIRGASEQTQILVGESPKLAMVVTLLALWLLWPAAIYAAIRR